MIRPRIMWFRRDLRVGDNAALAAACEDGAPVIPVFLVEENAGARPRGAASRAWLRRSLRALDGELRERGSGLLIAAGPADVSIPHLAGETGATTVHCSRDWDPRAIAEEMRVADACRDVGVDTQVSEGSLVAPPGSVVTASGEGYKVFTPFYRSWLRQAEFGAPSAGPKEVRAPDEWPAADRSMEFAASRVHGGPPQIDSVWQPGERGARARLERFLDEALDEYPVGQDLPWSRGTSELSPHLAFGEISPWQVHSGVERSDAPGEAKDAFMRQIAWRDFAYSVLHDSPDLAERPWKREFDAMPWREDAAGLEAWRTGATGFPMVDAGMRQLAATGWMHNRARMVVGSFLAKHLLIPWQHGENHFWDSLVDADPALNAFNWQWVAGSGADASPYFRIFNPTLQAQRFDANGEYVRRWVPELDEEGYPEPIVDHREARDRALAAYDVVKAARGGSTR